MRVPCTGRSRVDVRLAACGPLRTVGRAAWRGSTWRVATGGSGRVGWVRRSALCADSLALLARWSRRLTRYAHCVSCAQTGAASQLTMRAGARRPPRCAAQRLSQPARPLPPVAQGPRWRSVLGAERHRCCHKAACGQPLRRVGAAEERRPCGRARQRASTTDSRRLFERSSRSERSELSRGPQGRAPQGSPRAARAGDVAPQRLPARGFAAPASTRAMSAPGRMLPNANAVAPLAWSIVRTQTSP